MYSGPIISQYTKRKRNYAYKTVCTEVICVSKCKWQKKCLCTENKTTVSTEVNMVGLHIVPMYNDSQLCRSLLFLWRRDRGHGGQVSVEKHYQIVKISIAQIGEVFGPGLLSQLGSVGTQRWVIRVQQLGRGGKGFYRATLC